MTGGAQIDSGSVAAGNGGDINITAESLLTISGKHIDGYPSAVGSSTDGSGDGGGIDIFAGSIQLADGAWITAESSGAGLAGDILIDSGYEFLSRNSL